MEQSLPSGVSTLKVVDRRSEVRFEGALQASFTRSDAGGVRVVACSIVSLSASAMRIATSETVSLGQAIWVDVDGFGPVRASIETVGQDGFICRSMLNDAARNRLGTWVAWLARRNGRMDGDKRKFMRSRPHDSRTTIALEDGEVIAVALKDVSRSGAAVVSEHAPQPGAPVMIGRVPGRVSRTFAGGFAVEFEHVLEGVDADKLVSGYQLRALPISNTA